MTTKTISAMAAIAVTATLALGACSHSDSPASGQSASTATTGFDTSSIKKVDEIAALVPDSIKADGKLTQGVNIYYAPAEFYAEDGKTAIGYDMDLAKALANVMGLELDIQNAEFASILPGLPSKYEIGIANFTVNDERMQNFDMIPYFATGSSWTVAASGSQFDPNNICGATIGVQTGTYQDDMLAAKKEECGGDLDIQRYDQQSAVTTALIGGKIEAMYTDSSVSDYAIKQTSGQLKAAGEVTDLAPIATVTEKGSEFTKATQAALQYLMDQGYLAKIFEAWGIKDHVATTAQINPSL